MKKNAPVDKAISLSMLLTLGLMMANGAAAAAHDKKVALRRDRAADYSVARPSPKPASSAQ